MMKLLTPALALSMGFALSSTAATAEPAGPKTVIRMVILGTDKGEGAFSANAISISAGVGGQVIGGYVENSQNPVAANVAIGTAVFASSADDPEDPEDRIKGRLIGFNTSTYETVVCEPETEGCVNSGTNN
jgi:hypothetical protein